MSRRRNNIRIVERHPALNYALVIIGSLIVALALNMFLVPNKIAAGGVSGLATVVHHVANMPVGLTMLLVNIPLFVVSLKVFGTRFGLKSFLGAIATSVFIDVLAPFLPALTADSFLASIYGGLLSGVGIGLTLRAGGSTGGTDIAAQLLHHFTRLGVGRMLLVVDGLVILFAGIVFNAELALFAFIGVYVSSRMIDFIQAGGMYAKAAFIITNESEAIINGILHELERGVTRLKGQGMYTGEDRPVLFVIVSRREIGRLRTLVTQIDPQAFMVLTNVTEVLGEGFGPNNE